MAGAVSLTENSADNPGVSPKGVMGDDSHLQRQLKAGERILTQVTREKNKLRDANIHLDVELKDVRAQLADSVKENKKLRRGIYGKSSSELFDSSARKFIKKIFPCRNVNGSP